VNLLSYFSINFYSFAWSNPMFKQQVRCIASAGILLTIVLWCWCGQAEAAGNGGGTSEPIPGQDVCSRGIWVLQPRTAPDKVGRQIFEIYGLPMNRKPNFVVDIEMDAPVDLFMANTSIKIGRVEVPSNKTVELAFAKGASRRVNAKLTFFADPACVQKVVVTFP
jgi:hypothetical protein